MIVGRFTQNLVRNSDAITGPFNPSGHYHFNRRRTDCQTHQNYMRSIVQDGSLHSD